MNLRTCEIPLLPPAVSDQQRRAGGRIAPPGTRACLAAGVLALAALVAVTAAPGLASSTPNPEPETPGLWLVRLADPPLAAYAGDVPDLAPTSLRVTGARKLDVNAPASVAYRNHLRSQQDRFAALASQTLGRPIDVRLQYLHALNGMAVRVTPAEAAALASLPGVIAVHPDGASKPGTDVSHELILSHRIWGGATGTGMPTRGEGIVVGVLDTGINPGHPSFAATDGDGFTHTNPYGSGSFVGVCDPAHPAHEDICNDKLIGAWNFNEAAPNAQDSDGHGSQVASVIAGNRHEAVITVGGDVYTRTIQGVAPRANVISYLACVAGPCPHTSILAAVDQAIADGVDVLSYAISGADDPWTGVIQLAFLEAFDAGVFIAALGGNTGPGPGTRQNSAPWNVAAAASSHHRVIAHTLDATAPLPVPPGLAGMAAVPGTGPALVGDISAEILSAERVDPDNALGCAAFPAGAFTGAIALIQRGICTFTTKVNNAADAGASAVVVFNNVGGPPIVMGGLLGTSIPSAFIEQESGNALGDFIAGNSPAPTSAHLGAGTLLILHSEWQDVIAGFSSRGPSQFEILAPTLTAPGVNILSATVAQPGDPVQYAFVQGTSMSAAHAAGAGALLKALRPGWSPAEIRSALASAAHSEGIVKEDGETPATPFDMGSGRLDLDKAGRVGLVMDETYANFVAANPDTGGDPKTLNLPAMVNQNCAAACTWTRTVKHVADSVATYTALDVSPPGMTVAVDPATFTLAPGATQVIDVSVDVSGMPAGSWSFAELRLATGDTHLSGLAIAPTHYAIAVIAVSSEPFAEEIEQIIELEETVEEIDLPRGTTRSLNAKLQAARDALEAGDVRSACNILRALINQIRAQSGTHLTEEQAAELIAEAEAIRASLRCDSFGD
jgi:hypothetical protein